MENFLIRRADKNDFEDLLEMNTGLVDAMSRYYPKSERRGWNERLINFVKRRLKARFGNKNDLMFVAEKDSRIIGYIYGALKKEKFRPENYCHLEEIFVKKKFRGGIVGRSLLAELIKEVEKRGVRKFNVDIFVKNKNARKLFKKFRFCELSILYARN